MSINRWLSRGRSTVDTVPAAREALTFLTPETKSLLASLNGASPAICESVVQLIPFGSRAALLEQGLAIHGPAPELLKITPLGFAVIAAAAESVDIDRARPATGNKAVSIDNRIASTV